MQKYKNIAFSYVPKVIYRGGYLSSVFPPLISNRPRLPVRTPSYEYHKAASLHSRKQFANKPEQNLNLTQSATFPPFPTAHANAAFPTYGCADA